LKVSVPKSPGSQRVVSRICPSQLLFVPLPKLLCTHRLQSGFIVIEIYLFCSTSGLMSSVGNSNTPPHSSEQENSCGRRDTLRMLHLKNLEFLFMTFLIYMLKPTKTYWLSQSLRVESQKTKDSQVLTIRPPLSFTSPSVEEVFKVQQATCLVKISVRCLTCGLKMKTNKNHSSGKLHGVCRLVQLAL